MNIRGEVLNHGVICIMEVEEVEDLQEVGVVQYQTEKWFYDYYAIKYGWYIYKGRGSREQEGRGGVKVDNVRGYFGEYPGQR